MADREKVIKGLELCSREKGQTIGCLLDCPYDGEEDCYEKVMRDALKLLKAQEPKVMTLDESLEADFCWFETHGWKSGDYFEPVLRCPILDDESGRTFIDNRDCLFGFKDSEYGVTCRCWTSRPTDEQREAVKWEDAAITKR